MSEVTYTKPFEITHVDEVASIDVLEPEDIMVADHEGVIHPRSLHLGGDRRVPIPDGVAHVIALHGGWVVQPHEDERDQPGGLHKIDTGGAGGTSYQLVTGGDPEKHELWPGITVADARKLV